MKYIRTERHKNLFTVRFQRNCKSYEEYMIISKDLDIRIIPSYEIEDEARQFIKDNRIRIILGVNSNVL